MSNASRRVRPLIPESEVSEREVELLRAVAMSPRLSALSVEIIGYWCALSPVQRRIAATKVVMFRLVESEGHVVAPALAAEEQFMLDEVEQVVDPAAAAAAMRLLCVAERLSLVPVFRRFVADMADEPLP